MRIEASPPTPLRRRGENRNLQQKLRLLMSCLFVFSNMIAKTQTSYSFKYVDSLSYQLYEQKNWKQLSALGKEASKQNFDYYYINIRTAIAFTELSNYFSAEKYFKKALNNSGGDELARKYLLYIYQMRGDDLIAADMYNSFNAELKAQVTDPKTKFIYVEAGKKASDSTNIAGVADYLNLGYGFWPGKKTKMYAGYNYLGQNLQWGEYKIQTAYLSLATSFNKYLSLNLAGNYSVLNSNVSIYSHTQQYKSQIKNEIGGPFLYDTLTIDDRRKEGKPIRKVGAFYADVTWQKGRFKISPLVNIFLTSSNSDVSDDLNRHIVERKMKGQFLIYKNDIYSTQMKSEKIKATVFSFQPGIKFSYSLPFLGNRFDIGSSVYYNVSDSGKFIIPVPFVTARLGKVFWLNFDTFKKGPYVFADNKGSLLINSYDHLDERTRVTANILIKEKHHLYITLLHEKLFDATSLKKYQLNSVIVGFQYTF